MKRKNRYTVLEIEHKNVFVGIFLVLFFIECKNIVETVRLYDRKVAINAMFYALEEGYYAEKGYYPENIEKAEDLPWIDPNLFTDPYGVTLWNADADSNYSYDASNCEDGKCKSYTLRSTMEKEDDYVKTSRN